jgi:DNA-binding transcriptional LysR family regulator
LDLNDAAVFVRVVQSRSFTTAARERGVPVSTVSRRITRLESALGTRLLERTTRALRLTDAGRAYFEHAERAVDELARGTGLVRQRQSEPHGRVRILAPTALAAAVADVLYAFLARNPGVSIDLELGLAPANMASDGFDIAIVTGKITDTSDFVARAIWGTSRKLLFASPSYAKARGLPGRVDELAKHDGVATLAADGFATWTLIRGRAKRKLTFAPRFYVSEFAAAHRAVLAGVGIGLLPEVHCAADLAQKRLVRVLDGWEGESGGVSLLYRAHRSLTVAVRSCIQHFLAELPASDPARAVRNKR